MISLCIHERTFIVIGMTAASIAFVMLVSRYVRGKRAFNDALELYRRSQGQDWQ
jgi:hypothetical protein